MATLQAFVIIASALAAAYYGLKLCGGFAPMEQKKRLRISVCLCLAVLFGVGGLVSTTRITQSARPLIQGKIVDLRQSGGKSPSSYFDLDTGNGRIAVRCTYHGPKITDGQLASIKYLQEYGAVLDLEVLSGPNAGWQLHESDGLRASHLSMFAGAAFALFAAIFYLTKGGI